MYLRALHVVSVHCIREVRNVTYRTPRYTSVHTNWLGRIIRKPSIFSVVRKFHVHETEKEVWSPCPVVRENASELVDAASFKFYSFVHISSRLLLHNLNRIASPCTFRSMHVHATICRRYSEPYTINLHSAQWRSAPTVYDTASFALIVESILSNSLGSRDGLVTPQATRVYLLCLPLTIPFIAITLRPLLPPVALWHDEEVDACRVHYRFVSMKTGMDIHPSYRSIVASLCGGVPAKRTPAILVTPLHTCNVKLHTLFAVILFLFSTRGGQQEVIFFISRHLPYSSDLNAVSSQFLYSTF